MNSRPPQINRENIEHQIQVAIYLHKIQPWFPNFKRALLVPLMLAPTLSDQEFRSETVKVASEIMFTATDEFWRDHILRCHPPDKDGILGCNVCEHLHYLGPQNNYFSYGVQLTDLSFHHSLGESSFLKENIWWNKNFRECLTRL